MYRLNKINKEKANSINQKSKRSISEVHKIPEVQEELSDSNRPTDRLLLREQEWMGEETGKGNDFDICLFSDICRNEIVLKKTLI